MTSDVEAILHITDRGMRHAGMIYVPSRIYASEKRTWAEIVAGFLYGATANGSFVIRSELIYPGHDGLHVFKGERDELMFSWERFSMDMGL